MMPGMAVNIFYPGTNLCQLIGKRSDETPHNHPRKMDHGYRDGHRDRLLGDRL